MTTTHSAGPWFAKISTPEQESKKWGGNAGANACIYRKTGKYIYGIETTDVIVFLPHWRDSKQNEEQIANAMLIAAAPDLLLVAQKALSFRDVMAPSLVSEIMLTIQKATTMQPS